MNNSEKQVFARMHKAAEAMMRAVTKEECIEDGLELDDETRKKFRNQQKILTQMATVEYLLKQLAMLPKETLTTTEITGSGPEPDGVESDISSRGSCANESDRVLAPVVISGGNPGNFENKARQHRRAVGTQSQGTTTTTRICGVCEKGFVNTEALNRHKLIHSKPFICTVCGHATAEKFKLRRHCFRKHGNPDLFEDIRKTKAETDAEVKASEAGTNEDGHKTVDQVNSDTNSDSLSTIDEECLSTILADKCLDRKDSSPVS